MADNFRIAYNIANHNNTHYKLNVVIVDSLDKVIKSIDKEVCIEELIHLCNTPMRKKKLFLKEMN